MPSLKAIRKRISTTKATQKITRAMKMVAGARLARAQSRILALRPYALKTQEILAALAAPTEENENGEGGLESQPAHPYLAVRPEQNVALVVLTGDRGLCGAFNTNINKAAERAWREHTGQEGKAVHIFTAGRKGRDYLKRRGAPLENDFPLAGELNLDKARLISRTIMPRFVKGEIDSIYIVYNEFKSAMTQKVVVEKLLPLRPVAKNDAAASAGSDQGRTQIDYIYEPNKGALLDRLVPMYIEISILRALLESTASELGARMTAMDSATKNAKEMIDSLTLAYNRARQAAITKELMEIIGGAEALKE